MNKKPNVVMLKEKKTESIMFKANAVIFVSENTGFKIIKGVAYDESGVEKFGKCSLKGTMYDVEAGDEIFAVGYWEEHPMYGISFRVSSYVKRLPKTKKGILNYLKQGSISGISPSRAEKIVSRFGENTLDVLIYQTNLLSSIKGIGKKTIEKIKKSAKENLEQQSLIATIMMYIQGFDISPAYAKRIFEQYGIKSMEVIMKNPYRLADEVKGIGFLKADEIALKNGIQKDSPYRVESAVLFVMSQMKDEGDVYGKKEVVISKCCEFLELDDSYIIKAINHLIKDKRLVNDNDDLYLPKLFYAETYSAEKLIRLTQSNLNSFYVSDADIEEMSKCIGIKYAEAQIKAIREACNSNVIVITGGPGTGKTTVTNGIIRMCKKYGLTVACAAPTGKASKRMKEATEEDAKTIHKMLEMQYNEEDKKLCFKRNEENPLDEDVLIVDESSMIDILLLSAMLKAVPLKMKVIFIGDIDQLPSVGCGNVLHDIINSKIIPVIKLDVIFRQAEESDIVKNAHIINSGHTPDLKNKRTGDFFFIDADGMTPEAIRDKIVQYVCVNLPKCYNVSPDEIQVLTPMNKGHTGVHELNSFIQEKLNPQQKGAPFLAVNGNIFREGDKVMCVTNDYSNDVFNGDIGKIKTIKTKIDDVEFEDDNADDKSQNTYFSVDFDNHTVNFPINKIDNFVLSYAMTIHKSQGSEYDIVVMPLTNQNYIMLQRNLLYTGLTRAKKIFVLIGQKSAIRTAVHTLKVVHRNTHLDARIREEAELFGLNFD